MHISNLAEEDLRCFESMDKIRNTIAVPVQHTGLRVFSLLQLKHIIGMSMQEIHFKKVNGSFYHMYFADKENACFVTGPLCDFVKLLNCRYIHK